METRSVKFVDFWPGFNPEDNVFVRALRTAFDVRVIPDGDASVPDILFYSRCESSHHLQYDCLKVYYTGENDFPDFNECDYALSFYPESCGGRNLRYPLWVFYNSELIEGGEIMEAEALRRPFCSLVMRNARNCDPRRLELIDAVEAYRPVAYGGRYRNNVGGCVADKLDFIARYKFNLAPENSLTAGYVTEKILEPLLARTVPIYWGDRAVAGDFNPDAYINAADYDSLDSFMTALRRIDSSPAEYLAMLRAPRCIGETAARFDERLAGWLCDIAARMERHRTAYGEMGQYHRRNMLTYPVYQKKNGRRALRLISKIFG